MRIKEKVVDSQDQKTKLTRQFKTLMELHNTKLSQLSDLDSKIQQQRASNKNISEQYNQLKYKLSDAFLELQGLQGLHNQTLTKSVIRQAEITGFEVPDTIKEIDEERVKELVETEARKVRLEGLRKEEGYLAQQIKQMKTKTNEMSLAVNMKEYLNDIRSRQTILESACQKLQRKIDQDAHIESEYRQLFDHPQP